jgi:hypothetical protein
MSGKYDLTATRLARLLVRVLGEPRTVRLAAWLHKSPPPRCDYRSPALGDQCTYPAGHRGTCHTVTSYGADRFWYGANYRRTGGQT